MGTSFNKFCDDCGTAGKKANIQKFISTHGGAALNNRGKNGWTPLTNAAANGHTDYVELMLDNGADINFATDWNRTPLWAAAREGRLETLRLLLRRGADLDVQTKNGRTALFWASVNGYTECVRALLEAGANRSLKDNDGHMALDVAGNDAVKALLVEDPVAPTVPPVSTAPPNSPVPSFVRPQSRKSLPTGNP